MHTVCTFGKASGLGSNFFLLFDSSIHVSLFIPLLFIHYTCTLSAGVVLRFLLAGDIPR